MRIDSLLLVNISRFMKYLPSFTQKHQLIASVKKYIPIILVNQCLTLMEGGFSAVWRTLHIQELYFPNHLWIFFFTIGTVF
jgi:hypothetical protein